jgi:hypothetical protein
MSFWSEFFFNAIPIKSPMEVGVKIRHHTTEEAFKEDQAALRKDWEKIGEDWNRVLGATTPPTEPCSCGGTKCCGKHTIFSSENGTDVERCGCYQEGS